MKYEIVRMPSDEAKMRELLEEYSPFLDSMYTAADAALFGELNFLLDYWLFLWDTGTGFFLTGRDGSGSLSLLAMVTKFRDIWHGRGRAEIHRIALAADPALDAQAEIGKAVEYLKSVAALLDFDLLYYVARNDKGDEYKELLWNGRR